MHPAYAANLITEFGERGDSSLKLHEVAGLFYEQRRRIDNMKVLDHRLGRLAYVGARGMGALTFTPDSSPRTMHTAVEMNRLVETARAAIQGDLNNEDVATESLNELIQVGTSAGGARAKAIIAWNTSTGEMRAGGIIADAGFEQWLLQFDGVGADSQLVQAMSYGRTEYAYYLMATAAGVEMSECRLVEEGGRAHFVTRRFVRRGTPHEPRGARSNRASLAPCGRSSPRNNDRLSTADGLDRAAHQLVKPPLDSFVPGCVDRDLFCLIDLLKSERGD